VARSLTVQAGPQADETLAEAATAAAEDRRLVGEPDPGAWADAVGRWRARRRPYLLAYCGWRHAEALLATGDRAGAVDVLREAAAIAGDLGAEPLRAAIASLARRSRIELAEPGQAPAEVGATPEGTAPAAAADPFGLTRREREVLGLVALGRTNRQIADELFISENTAGVHVSNILGKLGVASRTEAAGVAVRLGLAAPEVDRV
jgi:DNA-binding CsgD family transcriptional regulator